VLVDMTRWVVQLGLDGGADLDLLPGSAGRHLAGSVGGGDATWDVVSPTVPEPGIDGVRVADAVAVVPLSGGHVPLTGARVKRTLLLRVRPGTPADVQERFEAELAAMPRYIDTISSWALSRVDQGVAACLWTHVWEQEYASVAGLRGEYMMNPYHWAGVDRWFDGEMPDAIVEPRLAHVFYEAAGPVLL
jgi:Stress responsive A/B Barrel Domain